MSAQAWSSATSLMVKSNSLRATKSTEGALVQRALGVDGDLGPDQAGLQVRIDRLQRLDGLHVGGEGRRRGMHDEQVVVLGQRRDVFDVQAVRRGVDRAGCSPPARPAARARSETSRTSPPGAPGSGSRRRRRNRRTKGLGGRAYAAWDAPDQIGRRLSRPPGDLSRAPSPDATAGRTPAGNSWRGEAPAPVGQPLRSARRLSANCQVSRAGTPIAISRARFSNERASAVSAGKPKSGPSTA